MFDLVIFDCDGVLYRGREALPHVPETFRALQRAGVPYRFITNNSTRTRAYMVERFRGIGIDAEEEHVHTSAYAARLYLDANAQPGAPIFVVGEKGLRDDLKGYKILSLADAHKAKYVIVGMDRAINYKKLAAAMGAIRAGAVFVATNRDATFPVEGGVLMPGGGTMVAAIETCAGPPSVTLGKPGPEMLHQLLIKGSVKPARALLVGDRADTDITAGNRARMKTCLVLTGVTTAGETPRLRAQERPGFVARDLRGVLGLLGIGRHKPAVMWKDFR